MKKSSWGIYVQATSFLLGVALLPSATLAHEPHQCPPGFPDAPVVSDHVEHSDLAAGLYSLLEIFEIGRDLFEAKFNVCDGQGRPATTGTGESREPGQASFLRTSAPDSNACAGCHNEPRPGGSGDFVANVFVLAQALDPVTFTVESLLSNERNTLGMFGAGAIDMLAREMTQDLRRQTANLGDGEHTLVTKGIPFDIEISGGEVVASRGVDKDLIIKPFHQAGVVRSIREFTVNAYNHHHGMQAEERFDIDKNDDDFDKDGVTRELTIGDITAATIFQAALAVPGRVLPADPEARREVTLGERLFEDVGCASCHVPELPLSSRDYVEPYPLNPPGTFSNDFEMVSFDMTREGERPRLEPTRGGGAVVRAYTDLKRHNLCDPETQVTPEPIRYFCNEQLDQGRPAQDGRPGRESFITRKLWDVGNSAPYGHRGDITTITEAILFHAGEARAERDAFADLPNNYQAAIVNFLKSLQVLPPDSPSVVVESPSRRDHGRRRLTDLSQRR